MAKKSVGRRSSNLFKVKFDFEVVLIIVLIIVAIILVCFLSTKFRGREGFDVPLCLITHPYYNSKEGTAKAEGDTCHALNAAGTPDLTAGNHICPKHCTAGTGGVKCVMTVDKSKPCTHDEPIQHATGYGPHQHHVFIFWAPWCSHSKTLIPNSTNDYVTTNILGSGKPLEDVKSGITIINLDDTKSSQNFDLGNHDNNKAPANSNIMFKKDGADPTKGTDLTNADIADKLTIRSLPAIVRVEVVFHEIRAGEPKGKYKDKDDSSRKSYIAKLVNKGDILTDNDATLHASANTAAIESIKKYITKGEIDT